MLEDKQILLVVYFVVIILCLVVFGVIFVLAFQKRKNKLLCDQKHAQEHFEDVLQGAKLEIQEQTLKNVSWELHDNIGQLLSTAVMQINRIQASKTPASKSMIDEVRELVANSLQEIRSVSRSLNHEVIHKIGLKQSITLELERYERLNFLTTSFNQNGEAWDIDSKDEIILFRIVQEFFSNTIKHAQASTLKVQLIFKREQLKIMAEDNGLGFDQQQPTMDSGLLNMNSRAQLIGCDFRMNTSVGQGTQMQLIYPKIRS